MKLSYSNCGALIGYFPYAPDQLRYLASLGYRYVDFDMFDQRDAYMADDWRDWVGKVAQTAADLDITLSTAHSPSGQPDGWLTRADATARLIRSIEVCGMLGIPRTVAHCLGQPRPVTQRDFVRRNVEYYRELLPAAERWNVEILLENLGEPRDHDRAYCGTGPELLELIDAINHPLVHACWDTGHANLTTPDQTACIRSLGGHLKAVHIHDNMGDYPILGLKRAPRPNMDQHTMPFFGNTNWDGVMSALLSIGYEGTFNLEVDVPRVDGKIPFRDGNDKVVDKLWRLPLELYTQSQQLLYNIAKHMLETFGCYEG
ncbi:MAG: sugar phosphate isomerase/epimerase [Oscillospiraceae bacterium]|nr:sugar phosphate isomerase/epimerase [Oscillospiraceae bacterium]